MNKIFKYTLVAIFSSFVSVFTWEMMHVVSGVDSEEVIVKNGN